MNYGVGGLNFFLFIIGLKGKDFFFWGGRKIMFGIVIVDLKLWNLGMGFLLK